VIGNKTGRAAVLIVEQLTNDGSRDGVGHNKTRTL
jgi:hypothetical protein